MALTKSDLQAISRLIDGKNFATKDDLKKLESKMATKVELKKLESKMATKVELKKLESKMATKVELKKLESKMATKADLKKIEKKFDDLFNFLDKDYIRVKTDVREVQYHLHLPVSDY